MRTGQGNNLSRFVETLVAAGVIARDAAGRLPVGWRAQDSREDKYEARVVRHPEGCWGWIGQVNPVSGYAYIGKTIAHRWAYENFVGPIPPGFTIDHLCRTHSCTNSAHLEPVTQAENNRRAFVGPTCRKGHPWTDASMYVAPGNGRRMCRICAAAKMRRFRARRTAARRAAA